MRGYICDGPCGQFWRGQPGAVVSFHILVDDHGERITSPLLTTSEVCPECTTSLLHTYGPTHTYGDATPDDFEGNDE